MSDPTTPSAEEPSAESTPEVPAAPAEPMASEAPAGAAAPPPPPMAPAYTPAPAGAAGPKQTLSLTSFILGIAGFLFSAAPVVNFLAFVAGLVAVILGFKAKKSEPMAPSWMSLIGIIAGFVAIGLSLLLGAVYLFSVLAPLIFAASYGYGY